MKTRTFVSIGFPRGFFSESTDVEVESRNHQFEAPSYAKNWFQYHYYDITEIEVDGEVLKGKPKNESKIYVRGELKSYQDILNDPTSTQTLKDNMRYNRWDYVLKCSQGMIPFDPNKHELSPLNN